MGGKFDQEPNRGWDFLGKWHKMAQPFADLAGEEAWPMWGSRTTLQALLDAVRTRLVGRPVDVGTGENRVTFILSSIEANLSPIATAAGQTDDVTLTARDLEWRSVRVPTVSATLRNIHTRMGTRPTLVCAPVDVSAQVTGDGLRTLLEKRHPRLGLEVMGDGQLRAYLTEHPTWGSVVLRPSMDRGSLVVRASGMARASRVWRFKRCTPSIRVRLALPHGVRITDLEGGPSHLLVHLRVDEWRLDYLDAMSMTKKSSP
jgi:hypothetical protein